MSAMPTDSDYESLCVPASLTFVTCCDSSRFPAHLLWSGGGPARGRLSYSVRCSHGLFAARALPGDLHPLSVIPRHGRCAAPQLTPYHACSASNVVLLPGTAALAQCNPWSVPRDFHDTAAFRCRMHIFSCDVISSTVMLGTRAHSRMLHEGFWSHLSPFSFLLPCNGWLLAQLSWCTPSDLAKCYAMAPKSRRWRYKPGQRERRERRLEREVAAARLAGDRSVPPLTLFHPQLSASLPDHVFQEEAVPAESVPVSSSEEYEKKCWLRRRPPAQLCLPLALGCDPSRRRGQRPDRAMARTLVARPTDWPTRSTRLSLLWSLPL